MTDPTTSESLAGSIERVTFHNPENGFCVLRVHIAGKRELTTVVGNSITVTPGEYIQCIGNWHNDRSHGLQFKASHMTVVQPTTIEGIEKYLASGLVKGIGPGFAKRLINAFGLKVFEVIERDPDKLQQVSGLGARRKQAILAAWEEQKKVREIVIFLHKHGVGTARAVRIYKTYGDQAISIVKNNPYKLAQDIIGIGFKTADALALNLGLPIDSPLRAEAGVLHVLQECNSNGDCAVLLNTLIEVSTELLNIKPDIIHAAIQQQITYKKLVLTDFAGEPAIFFTTLFQAEVNVAQRLMSLLDGNNAWQNVKLKPIITKLEKQTSITLAQSQVLALETAIRNKLVIITGGPGVGKTTLVNFILKIVNEHTDAILLCAPTGRAAKRMSETTGREAKTLHRLLSFDPISRKFKHDKLNPLEAELIIIDETSMVDILLMQSLLNAIPDHCALIIVGDVDQLPSIGPGAVLANCIASNVIPTVRLTEIFRQAAASQIILNAHKINSGQMPRLKYAPEEASDFYFVAADDAASIQQKIMTVVGTRIPQAFNLNPVRDIQVLTPMNKGALGTRSLNIELKNLLNHSPDASVQRYGTTFSVNDKVIQLVNNYDKDVYNGDIGYITEIDLENNQALVDFDDKMVQYEFDEFDELSLAYAITVHKAQGSEYAAVVLPISMQHFSMLERNLLYTGVTRGKNLVVLVGQQKALGIAIKNTNSGKRLTKLVERLEEAWNAICTDSEN